MRRLYLTIVIIILSVPLGTGCRSAVELDVSDIRPNGILTVEQASKIIGLPIPVPTYFPEGYEITSVQLEATGIFGAWDITITMENIEIPDKQAPNPVILEIRGFSFGLKLPPSVERIEIGDYSAAVFRHPDYIELLWIDKGGRELTLSGNRELQFEELAKIAASVTTPPIEILEARLDPDTSLVVLRGESQSLNIHLQNNSSKSLKVLVSQDSELPKGINARLRDSSLTIKPGQSVDVQVNVKVASTAPSPTWPQAAVVSPGEVPPPPRPVTTTPHYHLRFSISFTYTTYPDTLVSEHTSLSTELRVDPLAEPPEWMVTLQEAEEVADFPVAQLLPSYLPEGVSHPLGYKIGSEELRSITACYSFFRVILNPEPGVSEPPSSFTGERTVIRNKTAVIGQDRIDWWAYDIHFSVISDEIPISELKLVAESMMLIGVYSGSWLRE